MEEQRPAHKDKCEGGSDRVGEKRSVDAATGTGVQTSFVLDDVENDENVNTPSSAGSLKSWYDKAVSKAGDTYTDIMYIGTVLHYDSLLSKVLANARYRTKKYRAVISWAAKPVPVG